MLLAHRNQLTDFLFKLIDWFLFDEIIWLEGLNAAEKSLIKIRGFNLYPSRNLAVQSQ